MIELRGEGRIARPPADVIPSLGNAGFLLRCQSDVERVDVSTEDVAEWEVRPDYGFPVGTVKVVMRITERTPEGRVRYEVTGNGGGGGVDGHGETTVHADGDGSLVRWVVRLTAWRGILKILPRSVIESNALEEFEVIWGRIRELLEAK